MVLDKGEIIEQGGLEYLTQKKNGIFSGLLKSQIGGFLFAEDLIQ